MDAAFDTTIAKELRAPMRLEEICRQNVGWYLDRGIVDEGVRGWPFRGRSGLYFLWHKDDYCAVHARFHMSALYVGKGAFSKRIRNHWLTKGGPDRELIYFTFVPLQNRIAKYVEQLLLDLYSFEYNTAENNGSRKLCAYFEQGQVD